MLYLDEVPEAFEKSHDDELDEDAEFDEQSITMLSEHFGFAGSECRTEELEDIGALHSKCWKYEDANEFASEWIGNGSESQHYYDNA